MCSITLRMSPIVWCSLSIIVFLDCRFFTVVRTLWMPSWVSTPWDSQTMNSPPLLCTTPISQGYLDSQQSESCCVSWTLDLSLILVISSRLVTGSIAVGALKTIGHPWIVIFQGSMRYTAHSVHGASRAYFDAKWPYGLPLFLYMLQLPGYQYYWHTTDSP